MSGPPPLPRSTVPPSAAAVQQLREAASELDVDDLLDLCFAFAKEPLRLGVYLDVFRSKGSIRAQIAASLVCFDLARQGDARAESEFLTLVPVIREHRQGSGAELLAAMVGDDPYLSELLADIDRKLAFIVESDDGDDIEVIDEAEAIEIDLLGDDDFEDIEIELDEGDVFEVDRATLERAWQKALEMFLVPPKGAPSSDGMAFVGDHRATQDRVEKLRDAALSLEAHVTDAACMLPLAELFLATSRRSKNLFGRRSRTRDALVRAGLSHFTSASAPPELAVSWLLPPTAEPQAWVQIAEVLLDYVAFLGSLPPGSAPPNMPVEGFGEAYVKAERPLDLNRLALPKKR